jgi:hypothetical protein
VKAIENPARVCLVCGRKLVGKYRQEVVRTWHELPQRGCIHRTIVEGRVVACDCDLHLDGSSAVCSIGHRETAIQRVELGPKICVGYGLNARGAFHSQGCATVFAHAAAENGHRYKFHRPNESGQSLVEFAVVLPVFLLVLLLVFDGGGILWRFNMTTSIARLVARDASINGPVVASRNGVALAQRLGYAGVVTAKYAPGKRDVIVTATTRNRAILFGRSIPITATTSAHVEIVR